MSSSRTVRRAFVLGLFFLSGACGLLYELVWIRTAGTVIGNTTYAIGTVVGVYMAGLAIGARWGGRAADLRSGAALLRLYGILEAGVALSAAAVPFALLASEPLFRLLWNGVGDVTWLYAALRILLVGSILIVPTSLLGATLPALSRFLTERAEDQAREAGRAYALNTLGGVAGTLLGGFWLIPACGLRGTLFVTAGASAAVALGAIVLARGIPGGICPVLPAEPPPRRLALAVSALSGAASLLYEVAWSRSLVLSTGSSVQALTLILSAFILGLGLGSAIAARLVRSGADPTLALGVLQSAVGIAAILFLPFLGDLPVTVASAVDRSGDSYAALLAAEFGLIALFVLLPATLLGAVFPFACRLAARSERAVGRTVGAVYAWNTIGSIAGTVLGTFAFVPALGLTRTIRLAAALNLGLSIFLFARARGRFRVPALLPAAGVLLAWILPSWNGSVAASGGYLYGKIYASSARAAQVSLGEYVEKLPPPVAEYWDAYGLASVHRQGSTLALRVNGKVDASTGPLDSATQLTVGHLPMVHHPSPKRALVIGLGGGFTLGAVTRHAVEKIDCVEISSAVVRASSHFAEATGDPLKDFRVRLIVGDGRNLVQFSKESYDVIISEPSNLWVSGMANLFTFDFFQAVRQRLAPRGIFCQWVYASGLDVDDFRLVLRTFYTAFPEGSFWEVQPGGDYILLGGDAPAPVAYDAFESRVTAPGTAEDVVDPGVPGGLGLAGHLVTDAAGARRIAGPGPVLTDDRLTLEFTAPRSVLRQTRVPILELLDQERAGPAERRHFTGLSDEQARRVARRREDRRRFARAVVEYWKEDYDAALRTLDGAGAELGKDQQTLAWREDVLAGIVRLGAQSLAAGDREEAIRKLGLVPKSSSHWGVAQLEIAKVYQQSGRRDAARATLRGALADPMAAFDATLALAAMAEEEARWNEAVARWREAAGMKPGLAAVRLRLANSLFQLGRVSEARESVLEALRLDPRDPAARRMLDVFENP